MSTNQTTDQTAPEAAVAPKAPQLCVMGCGFFGSDATGNCCSKCWMDNMKKSHAASTGPTAVAKKAPVVEIEQSPKKVEQPRQQQQQQQSEDAKEALETPSASAAATPLKKKKKKKTSYKSLMASMTSGTKERDLKKERETIQGLGGGNFTKVEKI